MIKHLIQNLKKYRADYETLITKHPDKLPKDFYDNARKAILENAPFKAQQLFKLLNGLTKSNEFPEDGLTYDDMISVLSENEERIETLLIESKTEREIIGIGGKGHIYRFHSMVKSAIRQIDLAGEYPQSLLMGVV